MPAVLGRTAPQRLEQLGCPVSGASPTACRCVRGAGGGGPGGQRRLRPLLRSNLIQRLHPLCFFSRHDLVLPANAIVLSYSTCSTNTENVQKRAVKAAVLAGTQHKNEENHNQKHGAAINEEAHPRKSRDPINI